MPDARRPPLLLALLLAAACPRPDEPTWPDPTPIHGEVDVFVGTGGDAFAVGSAFPGPALPFGMARPGPDTQGASSTMGALHCSGYRAADEYVAGFSHLREHGTGVPDFGAVLLVPATRFDEGKRTEAGYRLSRGEESGRPGYYQVVLQTEDGPVIAELTSALRAGLHRYTFPSGAQAGVILDASHVLPEVEFVDGALLLEDVTGQRISGQVHLSGPYTGRHGGEVVYFAVRFDPAPTSVQTWDGGGDLGAYLSFDGAVVEAQVGVSFVDGAGAWNNLDQDTGGRGFDSVLEDAEAAWAEELSAFAVGGGGAEERAIFASSAYHALLMPTLFTDADGRYRGFDGQVHAADGWTFYTDFSLWDTYRTLHPLLDIVKPERQADFLLSLLAMSDQLGWMDRWPMGSGPTGGMVGDPQDVVFAGALIRGIGEGVVDPSVALDTLLATRSRRERLDEYVERGWLSADLGSGSVSETLEWAWADLALAEMADLAGEAALAGDLRAQGTGWRGLFDPATGFVRPRNADGSWVEPFDPEAFSDHYTEGDAWHYTFMAPLDLPGMVQGFGSEEALAEKLETSFLEASFEDYMGVSSFYWQGNEPAIHQPFLFALAGRPDLSRQWSRWAEDYYYGLGPAGLPGNDDAGTMGAWYVFSASGLFPLAGSTSYVLTEPRFPSVRLRVGDAELLLARAGEGDVLRVMVDGEEQEGPTIRWEQIREGAEVVFARGE